MRLRIKGLDRARNHAGDLIPGVVDTNPQALRRGRATSFARRGWNAYLLMDQMGWSQIETALWYIRLASSDRVKAFRELGEKPVRVPA